MNITFENVRPIKPGYEATIRISYGLDFWTSENLATGRLIAQFRKEISSDVICTVDTNDGSITREDDAVIVITISDEQTALMLKTHYVRFDLIREDQGVQSPIPGMWKWPVKLTVTRDV